MGIKGEEMKAKKILLMDRHEICNPKIVTTEMFNEAIAELEALQQPKRCDGCGYGKITINSVICGKNGTYKEADDYCKYYNPKEQ